MNTYRQTPSAGIYVVTLVQSACDQFGSERTVDVECPSFESDRRGDRSAAINAQMIPVRSDPPAENVIPMLKKVTPYTRPRPAEGTLVPIGTVDTLSLSVGARTKIEKMLPARNMASCHIIVTPSVGNE